MIQYVGVIIGGIASIYIYPDALDLTGVVQSLIAASAFMAPLISLGSTLLAVKYFPVFKDNSKKHNGFFGLMLALLLVGCLIYALIFPYISESLNAHFNKNESAWFTEYLPLILPITCLLILARLLAIYASNFQRIVVPAILEELSLKVTLPALILLYVLGYVTVKTVVYGVLCNYIFAVVGLTIYLWYLGELHLIPSTKKIDKPLKKEMTTYAGFGILNGMGSKSAFNIDTLMVIAYTTPTLAGIYSIANFLTDTINKPLKGIVGISQPIISKAFNENDMAEIKMIYKKSSITLLIYGIYLCIGIWVCLDDLFTIMSNKEMAQATYVVFFLMLAKLFNLATSVNNEIINYSKHFRFNLYALLTLSIINIGLNIYLIPIYGMLGAAIATFVGFVVFNCAKLIFIKWKFGFHPFSIKTLIIFVVGILTYFVSTFLPDLGNPYLNILIKGGVVTLLYPFVVYRLNISDDYNQLITSILNKFLK